MILAIIIGVLLGIAVLFGVLNLGDRAGGGSGKWWQ